MPDVIATVISQKGTCAAGHKVGEEFIISDRTCPGVCSWAFCTLLPFAGVLLFGGSFPWEEESGRTTVACPDAGNPVVFGLRRG